MIPISEIEKIINELDDISTKLGDGDSESAYTSMYLLGWRHKSENVSKRLRELLPK